MGTVSLRGWILAALRPVDYTELSPEEQWNIDKRLGILDWSGDGGEGMDKLQFCHCLASRMKLVRDDARYRLDRGINHTRFMLFCCRECGGYKGFPEENLLMFLEAGPEEDLQEFIQEVLKDARQKNED